MAEDRTEQLTTWLADGCRAAGVPGAVLGVRHGDRTLVAAHGVLDVRSGEPVTRDSTFQWGSITKLCTAVIAGQLVAEGALGWDTAVADVLPGLRLTGGADRITVEHLLSHASGIDGDVFDDTGAEGEFVERYLELVEGATSLFEPGAAYSYCNAGFVVLGAMVSKLDGRPWDEALRLRVAEPLGWSSWSTFRERAPRPGAAHGHQGWPHTDLPVTSWALPRALDPAGGMNGAAEELLDLATALFSDGDGRLLPAPVRAELVRERRPTPDLHPTLDGIGLAVRRHEWSGGLLLGHDGTTSGQHAYLRAAPAERFSVCLLTNGGEAETMARPLLEKVVAQHLGWTAPAQLDPLPTAHRPHVDDRWCGTYGRAAATYVVTRAEGDRTALAARMVPTGAAAELLDSEEHLVDLLPAEDDGRTFVTRLHPDQPWSRWTFGDLPGVGVHALVSGRVTPRLLDV